MNSGHQLIQLAGLSSAAGVLMAIGCGREDYDHGAYCHDRPQELHVRLLSLRRS